MSVWKARELWEPTRGGEGAASSSQETGVTATSAGTQCSRGCLCIYNPPSKTGSSFIVVGSWTGLLRGYYPEQASYTEDQLVFERSLPAPILQILAGNFIMSSTSSDNSFQVAVLHPGLVSLCFYTPTSSQNATDGFSLARSYNLKASAYAMVSGSFGGIRGRQMICVSTLDSRLTFIDNETLTETPVLDNFLLPGPVCYLPSKDALIVGSSCWTADCYSYSELAAAAGLAATKPGQEIKARKLWSYNCGEPLLDIDNCGDSAKAPVVLLGERHVFCLEQNGVMRSIRRLETPMNSLHLYSASKEGSFNALVTSTSQSLFVLQDMIPVWATQFPYAILAAKVARIGKMEGVIVTLAEDGHIAGWYLGTNPEIYESRHAASTRNFTSEEIKEETLKLLDVIRGHDDEATTAQPQPEEQALISVVVEEFNEISLTFDVRGGSSRNIPMCQSRVVVSVLEDAVHDLEVDFQLQEPFSVRPAQSRTAVVEKSVTFEFAILNTLQSIVGSLSGLVVARFMDSRRELKIVLRFRGIFLVLITDVHHVHQENFTIPFALVAQSAPLAKRGVLKFDFEISPIPLRFLEIFPDLVLADNEDNGLTIDFYGTGFATILISKRHETKVRIQSDEPGLVSVVCREIQRRVAMVHPEDSIVCTTNLPVSELQALLQRRVELSAQYQATKDDLNLWTQQLFVVEKRFLTRLKDRDAEIVVQLEELLDETQQKILEVVDQCAVLQFQLAQLNATISAMVSLIHFLVRINNQTLSASDLHELELVTHSGLEESTTPWEKQAGEAAKSFAYQKMARDKIASSLAYQTDLSDPFNLLQRAYLNQLSA